MENTQNTEETTEDGLGINFQSLLRKLSAFSRRGNLAKMHRLDFYKKNRRGLYWETDLTGERQRKAKLKRERRRARNLELVRRGGFQ